MSTRMKVACYAALFGVWGVFAYLRLTPVEGFIGAVSAAIVALGALHAKGDDAPPPPPSVEPPKDAP